MMNSEDRGDVGVMELLLVVVVILVILVLVGRL